MVIAMHVTGINREKAKALVENPDIATSCASTPIRNLVKPPDQVETAFPLFALTRKGKELVIERAKEVESPIFINPMALPVLPEHKQLRDLI